MRPHSPLNDRLDGSRIFWGVMVGIAVIGALLLIFKG